MTPRRRLIGLAAVITSSTALSCIDRFETPSAYEGVSFLCGDEDDDFAVELEARIAACRNAGPSACGGVLNLRGELEDTPLALLTEVDSTSLSIDKHRDSVNEVVTTGLTPYAVLSIEFESLGADLATPASMLPRTWELSAVADKRDDQFEDEVATLRVRLQSGRVVSLRSQSGSLTFTRLSREEVRGHFAGAIYQAIGGPEGNEDDTVEACFHLFPSES